MMARRCEHDRIPGPTMFYGISQSGMQVTMTGT